MYNVGSLFKYTRCCWKLALIEKGFADKALLETQVLQTNDITARLSPTIFMLDINYRFSSIALDEYANPGEPISCTCVEVKVVLVGERTLYLDRTQSNLLHRHSPETHQCAVLWYGDSKAGEVASLHFKKFCTTKTDYQQDRRIIVTAHIPEGALPLVTLPPFTHGGRPWMPKSLATSSLDACPYAVSSLNIQAQNKEWKSPTNTSAHASGGHSDTP
ncbi:hypothetical protein P692DRAFT_201809985 [Suillus brevipes Sb2]|nr:hypothetical protein P692DRAFT_201809985 [Suillus brevipes Sb2]